MLGSVTASLSAATDRRPARHRVADRLVHERDPARPVLSRFRELKGARQSCRLASVPMRHDLRVADDVLDSRYRRALGERPAQLRMVRGAMIALAVVLPHQLPVAVLDDRALEGDSGVGELVGRCISFELSPERLEARRNRRDADEDIAAGAFAADRLEPGLRLVDPAVLLTGANQAAVQIVGPLMIGADEPLRRALGRGADPRAAMPARIMEGADRSVAAAQDDDRIVADLDREVVARRRDLAIVAGEQPVAVEEGFEIEAVELGVGIEFPVEAHAGAPGLKLGEHGVGRVHLSIPDRRGRIVDLCPRRHRPPPLRKRPHWRGVSLPRPY